MSNENNFKELTRDILDAGVSLLTEDESLLETFSGPLMNIVRFGATRVNISRFKRFADTIANKIKSDEQLSNEEKKKFYEWVVGNDTANSYFHDFIRQSLSNNSRYIQICLGLIYSESYKKYNISYMDSRLFRGLDRIDDYEVELLLDYLDAYREDLLKEGDILLLNPKAVSKVSQVRSCSETQVDKELKIVFEALLSRGILPNRMMHYGDGNLKISVISDLFIEVIRLLREARKIVEGESCV